MPSSPIYYVKYVQKKAQPSDTLTKADYYRANAFVPHIFNCQHNSEVKLLAKLIQYILMSWQSSIQDRVAILSETCLYTFHSGWLIADATRLEPSCGTVQRDLSARK